MSSIPNPYRLSPPHGTPSPTHLTPLNPLHFLLRSASISPSSPALIHPERNRSWTYSQWSDRCASLAYALKSRGVKRGDRVGVMAPNVPMMADVMQGVLGVGAVVVPINTRLTPPEIIYILNHSGATFLLIDSQFSPSLLPKLRQSLPSLPYITSHDPSNDPKQLERDQYERFLAEGRRWAEARGLVTEDGRVSWEGLEDVGDEDEDLAICYTSGTTGRPKGVLYTYRGAYLAAISNMVESKMDRNSVYLWILPMFHCCGWTFPWSCTSSTSTQICLRSVGTYDLVWSYFLTQNVTHYCGAPTVQLSISTHPSARPLPRPITTLVAGAAPTPKLIRDLSGLGIGVTHVYGLTETYGPITRMYLRGEEEEGDWERRARQGWSFLCGDEVRVFKQVGEGEEGEEREVRWDGKDVGEICFKGNIVMKEYYRDADATRKALKNGWFHTGDLAVRFPDGSISIQDRSKDIIISGGENASSLFIESQLSNHPDILEVAVVARPHHKFGERPHAFVVLKPGEKGKWDVTRAEGRRRFESDVKEFSKSVLAGFARPEWVELVEELPKTSTGKVSKVDLRKRASKL